MEDRPIFKQDTKNGQNIPIQNIALIEKSSKGSYWEKKKNWAKEEKQAELPRLKIQTPTYFNLLYDIFITLVLQLYTKVHKFVPNQEHWAFNIPETSAVPW